MRHLKCPDCGASLTLILGHIEEPQNAFEEKSLDSKALDLEVQKHSSPTGRKRYAYPDPSFAAFWSEYPRKVGKAAAYRKWKMALREIEAPQIIEACRKFGAHHSHTEAQFIPYPEKWLSAGRWDDELDVALTVVTPREQIVGTPEWQEAQDAEYERLQAQGNEP